MRTLGAEGTSQDQRNQRAPLSGFPLNADRRRALHSCSLASRPGAAACPQPSLPGPEPAETEGILARIQGPCRPETDPTLQQSAALHAPWALHTRAPPPGEGAELQDGRVYRQGHPERSKDSDRGAHLCAQVGLPLLESVELANLMGPPRRAAPRGVSAGLLCEQTGPPHPARAQS